MTNRSHRFISALWPKLSTLITGYIPCDLPDVLIQFLQVIIIEIKAMAERKEFDVLLVFMFDRLGRREDETPFLVEWFVKHGIEVWSTREGQQKIDNRSDKLMNYIRYWMAGGESEKTSMRVKAAHTQMTSDGIWRGGKHPYGYKLVHNGRVGKKNRQLYDLEIDPVQAPIVQEIFQLVGYGGLGTLQVANLMNERHPESGKIFIFKEFLCINSLLSTKPLCLKQLYLLANI